MTAIPKDSTSSTWQVEKSPYSDYLSSEFPETANIVIIGTGFTGISTAYHILNSSSPRGRELGEACTPRRQAYRGGSPLSMITTARAHTSHGQSLPCPTVRKCRHSFMATVWLTTQYRLALRVLSLPSYSC